MSNEPKRTILPGTRAHIDDGLDYIQHTFPSKCLWWIRQSTPIIASAKGKHYPIAKYHHALTFALAGLSYGTMFIQVFTLDKKGMELWNWSETEGGELNYVGIMGTGTGSYNTSMGSIPIGFPWSSSTIHTSPLPIRYLFYLPLLTTTFCLFSILLLILPSYYHFHTHGFPSPNHRLRHFPQMLLFGIVAQFALLTPLCIAYGAGTGWCTTHLSFIFGGSLLYVHPGKLFWANGICTAALMAWFVAMHFRKGKEHVMHEEEELEKSK